MSNEALGEPLYFTRKGGNAVYSARLACGHAGGLVEPAVWLPTRLKCRHAGCLGRQRHVVALEGKGP
jgi:hypothetical protein